MNMRFVRIARAASAATLFGCVCTSNSGRASPPVGATTSNRKTFSLGSLKPGATTKAVWKLSAVKAGKFTLLYRIDAGLSGTAKAETNGVAAGGSFATEISAVPPDTEVTDDGEVVEKAQQRRRAE